MEVVDIKSVTEKVNSICKPYNINCKRVYCVDRWEFEKEYWDSILEQTPLLRWATQPELRKVVIDERGVYGYVILLESDRDSGRDVLQQLSSQIIDNITGVGYIAFCLKEQGGQNGKGKGYQKSQKI